MENKEDPKYPILSVSLQWKRSVYAPKWLEIENNWSIVPGHPDLQYEHTSASRIDRVELKQAEVLEWINKVCDRLRERHKEHIVGDIEYTLGPVRYETWMLEWFQHVTIDIGQTDEEVLDSFENYISRVKKYNQENGEYLNGYWHDPISLMGAEDRWRWHGTATGDPSERTDPPCRCEHCKEQGVIRIGH